MAGEGKPGGTDVSLEEGGGRKQRGRVGWILLGAVVILALLAAAYLTIEVAISEAPPAASYPYSANYQVSLPASQPVTIGNSEIIAIPTDNQVTLSINGQPTVMAVGETKTIQEKRAMITDLSLEVMAFDFRLDATYLGRSGDTAQFSLTFRTSEQVPSFLVGRLLPPGVQARPA